MWDDKEQCNSFKGSRLCATTSLPPPSSTSPPTSASPVPPCSGWGSSSLMSMTQIDNTTIEMVWTPDCDGQMWLSPSWFADSARSPFLANMAGKANSYFMLRGTTDWTWTGLWVTVCPAGMFWNSSYTCYTCPVGSYCPVPRKTMSSAELHVVPQLKPNTCISSPCVDIPGGIGYWVLPEPCPAGAYCPTAGLASPVLCPTNYYCPPASAQPTACPDGLSSDAGARSVDDCRVM